MDLPLITILTLNYNHRRFCIDTLESIRLQSYSNLEVIIIDNGSSDGSLEQIKSWEELHSSFPVSIIANNHNLGISKAINQGLQQATGEYIAMVACDDLLSPLKLEKQLEVFSKDSRDLGMVYSDAFVVDSEGELLPYSWFERLDHKYNEGMDLFVSLLNRNFILPASTLVKRSVFDQIGGFDESLSFEDYDMNLRIADGFDVAFSNYKSASYRRHSANTSNALYTRHADSYIAVMSKYLSKNHSTKGIVERRIKRIVFFAAAEDFDNGQMLQKKYSDLLNYPWYITFLIRNALAMKCIYYLRRWYKNKG